MRTEIRWWTVVTLSGIMTFGAVLQGGEEATKNIRLLYDLESGDEVNDLLSTQDGITGDAVQDNVSHGKGCARLVFAKGRDWDYFEIKNPEKLQNWSEWDYFAMDITVPAEGEACTDFCFEIWDKNTTNFKTRCTFERNKVVHGKQTVYIQINRARRNNRGGNSWEQLDESDKINMNRLTKVKIFLAPPKEHDIVWFVDNIRLLKEEALGHSMDIGELPAGSFGFKFGNGTVKGLANVSPNTFVNKADLTDFGKGWPDVLTGNGLYSPTGHSFKFVAELPDGDYWAWIASAPHWCRQARNEDDTNLFIFFSKFYLRIGDQELTNETPKASDIFGERYAFRFMKTIYSQRPHALWEDYVNVMYPVYERKVRVTGGKLELEGQSQFLSALILVPAAKEAEFKALSTKLKAERIRMFDTMTISMPQPVTMIRDKLACFVPNDWIDVTPGYTPSAQELARKSIDLVAAPGQNVIFRVAISTAEDLGTATIQVDSIKGPTEIPVNAIKTYFQNYWLRGTDLKESALLPVNEAATEGGVTRCFYFWLKLSTDIQAGDYAGQVTVNVEKGGTKIFPITLKILPLTLDYDIPYSLGIFYTFKNIEASFPNLDADTNKKLIGEQLAFLRELGFTGIELGNASRDGGIPKEAVEFAKAAGFGKNSAQMSIIGQLGMARQLARGMMDHPDRNPGAEFGMEEKFHVAYLNSARKMLDNLKKIALPYCIWVVDEPREMPNPWNRSMDHTNLYADWLHEIGAQNLMVTPMGDRQSGKDYTPLIDHHDIVATHAGKASERMMFLTPQKGKALWLYNTGMDRLSWGFYNYRVGSKGRWEWHFYFPEGSPNVSLNMEWYNPFVPLSPQYPAPRAPYMTYPGGFLFRSRFLSVANGITDTVYIYNLEKLITTSKNMETVEKAKALLTNLKDEKTIPFLSTVAGMGNDLAKVGEGVSGPNEKCETWRREIANLLVELAR